MQQASRFTQNDKSPSLRCSFCCPFSMAALLMLKHHLQPEQPYAGVHWLSLAELIQPQGSKQQIPAKAEALQQPQ